MLDFIQKFIYFILNIQSKLLGKKSCKNMDSAYSNTISKKRIGSCASFEMNTHAEKAKIKLENDVKIILNKYSNNPQKLLEFVQKNGTKVYKIPFAKKILSIIGYEDGFVGASKGFKAFYLNLIVSVFEGTKTNFSSKTEPMFILNRSTPDKYYTIQQFHKWYAMQLNLPGFDSQSQTNFQKYLNAPESDVKELSIDEILGLKEAIARDVEAINFVVEMAKSYEGSRKANEKVTAGGASV